MSISAWSNRSMRSPASALYGSDGLADAVSFTTSDRWISSRAARGRRLARAAYSSADNEFSRP